MADMTKAFRAAMDQPDPETPTDAGEPGDSNEDAVCPMCGASAMKIVQASLSGGGSKPPLGGGGPMGGM